MPDPAATTSSFLMNDWTDDEVTALATAAATGGDIDPDNMAFAKARAGSMLHRTRTGWTVRDSAATAANYQLSRRA